MNTLRLLRPHVRVAAMCLAVAMCSGYKESTIGSALEEYAVPRVGVRHSRSLIAAAAAALTRIIPELRNRGYKFATVSEFLASAKAMGVTECYENQPHDNRRYDVKSARKIR